MYKKYIYIYSRFPSLLCSSVNFQANAYPFTFTSTLFELVRLLSLNMKFLYCSIIFAAGIASAASIPSKLDQRAAGIPVILVVSHYRAHSSC